jgi:hypothetical protein
LFDEGKTLLSDFDGRFSFREVTEKESRNLSRLLALNEYPSATPVRATEHSLIDPRCHMTRFCALAGFALAVSLASGNSADAVAAVKKVPTQKAQIQKVQAQKVPAQKVQTQKGHAHHLLKAEEDLVAAEASIASGNLSQAQKHVAAAVKQLEEAIAHHHKHHISQPASGGGTVGKVANRARHAHHHATLKQAVAELVVAERELKAGAGAQASKEIVKASKTIKNAVTSHHHLFGKT